MKPVAYGPPHASCPSCGRITLVEEGGLVPHLLVIHAVDPDGTRRGPECPGSRSTPAPELTFRFPARGDV